MLVGKDSEVHCLLDGEYVQERKAELAEDGAC